VRGMDLERLLKAKQETELNLEKLFEELEVEVANLVQREVSRINKQVLKAVEQAVIAEAQPIAGTVGKKVAEALEELEVSGQVGVVGVTVSRIDAGDMGRPERTIFGGVEIHLNLL